MDSPTLLNVPVESVLQHWLSLTVEYKYAIRDRLVMAVVSSMGVLYADNSLI